MSERTLKILLVLSLAFNLSFLATVAYIQLKEPTKSDPHLLVEHLDITKEQEGQIMEEMYQFHSKINEIRLEIRPWKRMLLDEIQSKKPDQARIKTGIGEIGRLQQELQEAVVQHLLITRKELNSEQNKKFMSFLEEGMLSSSEPEIPDMMRHWFFE